MPPHITILYSVCGSLVGLIGVLAIYKSNRSLANIFFALFSFSLVVWISSLYFGYFFVTSNPNLSLYLIRLAVACQPLAGGILLPAFLYAFPRSDVRYPKIAEIIYLTFSALLVIISVTTSLTYKAEIIENGMLVSDVFGPLYGIYILHTIFSYILVFLIGIRKLKKTTGIERKKIVIIFWGIGITVFLAIMTNTILPFFGIYILQLESPAFALTTILGSFYAIHRYRFFYVSNIVLKAIRNLGLVLVFTGSAILADYLLDKTRLDFDALAKMLISALLGLAIFSITKKITPELSINSIRGFRKSLEKFASDLYSCKSYADLESLIENIFKIDLNINKAEIYVIGKQNTLEISVYSENRLTKALEKTKELLVASELQLSENPKDKSICEKIQQLGGEICLPLKQGDDLIGFFLLGKKADSKPYSREELEVVYSLKNQLTLGFTNLLLKTRLKERIDVLKKILDKRTDGLRQQNRRIRELLSQQADFISASAHELRTPLNIALLQIEMLENSFEEGDEKEDVKTALNAMEKLHALVNKLFSVQKYDFNKAELKLQKTDFGKFLEEIYKNFLPLTKEKSLRMKFENKLQKQTWLQIDPLQIQQVFHNLLSNAIKFTPAKGEVILRVEEANNRIKVCIADNGPGIPDKQKKMVFEKFKGGVNSKEGGIGLGLYICKKILDLHKGKIWIEDTPRGGSSFCVELLK